MSKFCNYDIIQNISCGLSGLYNEAESEKSELLIKYNKKCEFFNSLSNIRRLVMFFENSGNESNDADEFIKAGIKKFLAKDNIDKERSIYKKIENIKNDYFQTLSSILKEEEKEIETSRNHINSYCDLIKDLTESMTFYNESSIEFLNNICNYYKFKMIDEEDIRMDCYDFYSNIILGYKRTEWMYLDSISDKFDCSKHQWNAVINRLHNEVLRINEKYFSKDFSFKDDLISYIKNNATNYPILNTFIKNNVISDDKINDDCWNNLVKERVLLKGIDEASIADYREWPSSYDVYSDNYILKRDSVKYVLNGAHSIDMNIYMNQRLHISDSQKEKSMYNIINNYIDPTNGKTNNNLDKAFDTYDKSKSSIYADKIIENETFISDMIREIIENNPESDSKSSFIVDNLDEGDIQVNRCVLKNVTSGDDASNKSNYFMKNNSEKNNKETPIYRININELI